MDDGAQNAFERGKIIGQLEVIRDLRDIIKEHSVEHTLNTNYVPTFWLLEILTKYDVKAK